MLFLTNLPSNTTEASLVTLFQNYTGFKEVRMVPGKSEIAFVEYETTEQAKAAKHVLDGFQISATHAMQVSYSKR